MSRARFSTFFDCASDAIMSLNMENFRNSIFYSYIFVALVANMVYFGSSAFTNTKFGYLLIDIGGLLGIVVIALYILLIIVNWKKARKLTSILLLVFPTIWILAIVNDLIHFNCSVLELLKISWTNPAPFCK